MSKRFPWSVKSVARLTHTKMCSSKTRLFGHICHSVSALTTIVKPLLLSVWGCDACGVCTFERKQLRSAAAGAGRGGLSKVAGPGTKAQWSLNRLTSCFRSAFRSDDEWCGEGGVCCVADMLAATVGGKLPRPVYSKPAVHFNFQLKWPV